MIPWLNILTDKWNPQLFRTPEELNAALEQFEVKDKKIKAMEQVYLPGKIRDRIQELMKATRSRRLSLLLASAVRKVC